MYGTKNLHYAYDELKLIVDTNMNQKHTEYKKIEALEQEVYKLTKCLTEIRNNRKLWKSSGAGGGQDQYVGMPPAMRIIDEAVKNND